MSVPFAVICMIQAIMFFVLTILRRKYSDHVSRILDRLCGCGIVNEEILVNDDEEQEESTY